MKHRMYSVSVTTTSKLVCRADPKRLHLKIFESAGGTAVLTHGQNVAAADGYPVVSATPYQSDFCQGEYWALTASGTATLRVEEVSE